MNRLLILFLSAALWASGTAAQVPADSTIVPVAVATDSTADSLRTDPLRPWLKWKDLGRAIALRPLDGPTDIMEKTEIIQDRLDALEEAKSPLQGSLQHPAERLAAIEIQLEVLQDLAQLQRGGDLELQQRLHDMRADRRRLEQAMRPYWAALADLQREIDRLNELLRHYQSRAADLRRKEEIIR